MPNVHATSNRGPTIAKRRVEVSSIAEAIVGLLNGKGGRIVIGVDGDGALVVGEGRDLSREWQISRPLIEESISPPPRFSVVERDAGDGKIVLIDVPEGPERPYTANGRIFVADGTEVRSARPDDISDMIFARAESGARWEHQLALGATIADLDSSLVKRIQSKHADRDVSATDLPSGTQDYLEHLHVLRSGQLLNSAVVLFARKPAEFLPQCRVRAARFASDDRTKPQDNRVFTGNLFALFGTLMRFLELNVPIRSIYTKDMTRSDARSFPPFVMREAIMNALVHRDYTRPDDSVWVAIHPTRLEIWNPGSFPEGLSSENVAHAGVSRPRNPDIANAVFLMGLIEQWGSGTQRIVAECLNAQLPSPVWEEVGGGVRLIVKAPPSAPTEPEVQEGWSLGAVKWFNESRGFGFIVDREYGDIFFHHSDLSPQLRESINEGDPVAFRIHKGSKGLVAKNVKRAE